ncbi:MAG: phosphatidylglycerol lysyltransferase domain-containing protein, partial [Actinomycetota bacterium]|nr:phosphatidylglycerol lysyltransferase domain-containing protein [Actinomycetota bacterium]
MNEPSSPSVPDVVTLDVAVGGRVLVVSDLRLGDLRLGNGTTSTPAAPGTSQTAAVAELVSAIEAWSGPGALVFNGNLVTAPSGAAESRRIVSTLRTALTAHPRLVEAAKAFAAGPGRRVLVLPGGTDACLAWHDGAQAEVARQLGAEVAVSATLRIETGSGTRVVQVEPGHRLDPLAAFGDPRNPGESPLAQHLREDVLPAAAASQGTRRRAAWLAGAEQLDDPAAFPRFVASRLTYRRLARAAWLLLLPIIAGIALRAPALALARTRGLSHTGARTALLLGASAVEVILLAAIIAASIRGTWQALSALSLGVDRRDPNEAARSLARDLVTAGGHSGLITGHTCRPELTHLGAGFYANTGCATEVVAEVAGHLPGLGLPSVFLGHRQIAWVELEAGADLHVRLLHARAGLPGATVAERMMARRGPDATESRGEVRPEVVATFPKGRSWPPATNDQSRRRLVRRVAALFVAVAGFITLVSSLSDPVRDRLTDVRDVFPIVVPETAAALTALAGVGLLLLARGIRRGQHRAWAVCQVVLLTSAVLHLVKGADVEEAVVALAVATFLWVNRASFRAAADIPPLRRGIAAVAGSAVATIVAGALGIEISTWISAATRRGPHFHLSWARAFQAIVERGVGVHHVFLPHRIDRFVSPGAVAVAVALVVVTVALTFRPVVIRARHRGDRRGAAGGPGSGPAGDLARARAIVGRHGSGTLDYFALRPDKDFFFWGDTLVAHAVYGGVCLVSPDPIGPVAEREEAWRAFRSFVDRNGWALGGLGAGEEWLPIYRATGMHDLY